MQRPPTCAAMTRLSCKLVGAVLCAVAADAPDPKLPPTQAASDKMQDGRLRYGILGFNQGIPNS